MSRLIQMSLVIVAALGACGRKDEEKSAPDVTEPGTVGSFNYYLELATLHERYLDPKTAVEDMQQAVN